ncbi:MAG: hypothetical protein KDA24_23060 [Deltaproteobacteria bacterium]|nr:hypothetical protein [Deltaproteobacteria bacterium]
MHRVDGRRSRRNLPAVVGFLLVLLMGCGDTETRATSGGVVGAAEPCVSPRWQSARRALVDGLGLPATRNAPGRPELGPPQPGDGHRVHGVRWPHPSVEGEFVHGLLYVPEPAPTAPVPLVINMHGHWGGGADSDEVNRRAQIIARQGWLVVSLANRGMELGGDTPGWRRLHHEEALYAQLRSRRSGGTPVGWDVVAGWSAVDLAVAGRLPVAVDLERIGVMGFSGGAERAAVLAATDPRVGPVVVGAYEYAFSSGHGHAQCSCGAVRGAGTPLEDPVHRATPMPPVSSGYKQPVQAWRWLGLAACRPGPKPSPRPLLAWDNQPEDPTDSELLSVASVTKEEALGVHGITPDMAVRSWAWMAAAFGGAVSSRAVEEAARATEARYDVIHPATWMPLAASQPAPGQLEQGPPPWRVDASPHPAAARQMLGLGTGEEGKDPALALHLDASAEQTLLPPLDDARRPPRSRAAWLVVLGEAGLGPIGADALRGAAPDAVVLTVRHRLLDPDVSTSVVSRFGIEVGVPPLGVAVHDVLRAHRRLVEHPDVDPARIGFVGIADGGVVALQAAVLVGEGGPVGLVEAPTTLFEDGPREGAPFAPWPHWTLVALPGGASFDPWLAAKAVATRLRWLDPRGGDGEAWTEHLPHGDQVPDLRGLLAPTPGGTP